MAKGKDRASNLGARGYLIVAIGFVSFFLYSALMNDSLNQMIPALAAAHNLNPANLYLFATPGTIAGILGGIAWGQLMHWKSSRVTYVTALIVTAIFACVWGNANSTAMYGVGFLICYFSVVGITSVGLTSIIGNWFPRKRGLVMGWVTAGFPLSAAFTSRLTNAFIGIGFPTGFYYLIAGLMVLLAIIVFFTVRDYPEDVGCVPDNDPNFDRAKAQKELEAGMAYLKTSKWTIKKVLCTPRFWHLWFSCGVLGFSSMGIMSNFFGRFGSMGYQVPEILNLLLVVGIVAIPGSIFIGWLDVKLGTKKAALITFVLGIIAIAFLCTDIRPLHYIACPLLSLNLGGASNFALSLQAQIWGRYDFKNVLRVMTPMASIFSGLGVSFVGYVGNNMGYNGAFIATLILVVLGFIGMILLNTNPIDKDAVR